jgi:hypothetical protein
MRYFRTLYKELRIWRRFYKGAKRAEGYLNENNLRVDKLGRIYTVVNVPEEVANNNQYVKEAWVLQQLKPYNEILLKVGLADYAMPELRAIDEPGTNAFLILLYPELDNIKFGKFIWNVIKLAGLILAIKIVYNVISINVDLAALWESISNYL